LAGSASAPGYAKAFNVKTHNKPSPACHRVPTLSDPAAIIVAEFPISSHVTFRAELVERQGRPIVSISRWKTTPAGTKRAGAAFEFAAHRTGAVANILSDLQRVLASLDIDGGAK
jgi:hypothetical protein